MKRNILQKLAALLFLCCTTVNLFAQTPEQWKTLKGDITLYMANDLGRNGYYEQKPIAELMGKMAETVDPEMCDCRWRHPSFQWCRLCQRPALDHQL